MPGAAFNIQFQFRRNGQPETAPEHLSGTRSKMRTGRRLRHRLAAELSSIFASGPNGRVARKSVQRPSTRFGDLHCEDRSGLSRGNRRSCRQTPAIKGHKLLSETQSDARHRVPGQNYRVSCRLRIRQVNTHQPCEQVPRTFCQSEFGSRRHMGGAREHKIGPFGSMSTEPIIPGMLAHLAVRLNALPGLNPPAPPLETD